MVFIAEACIWRNNNWSLQTDENYQVLRLKFKAPQLKLVPENDDDENTCIGSHFFGIIKVVYHI